MVNSINDFAKSYEMGNWSNNELNEYVSKFYYDNNFLIQVVENPTAEKLDNQIKSIPAQKLQPAKRVVSETVPVLPSHLMAEKVETIEVEIDESLMYEIISGEVIHFTKTVGVGGQNFIIESWTPSLPVKQTQYYLKEYNEQ